MMRCLELANRGLGYVNPNPLVGCVIVNNNQIISEGWHKGYGQNHAERMAILQLENKTILSESTIYVNLEPCSHYGKTPPCANLLIKHKVKRVVIGMVDPNPLVSGKGIQLLRDNGIEVIENVLNKECLALNKYFVTFHSERRPYIILKWAETSNGFIAPIPLSRKQISGADSQKITHKLRQNIAGILVGVTTWNIDNPMLNNRYWPGNSPLRFVIDKDLKGDYSIDFVGDTRVVVFNSLVCKIDGFVEMVKMDFDVNFFRSLFNYFYDLKINSLLVEGGATTLKQFIDHNAFDEIHVFKSNQVAFENGLISPDFQGNLLHQERLMQDAYSIYGRSNQ